MPQECPSCFQRIRNRDMKAHLDKHERQKNQIQAENSTASISDSNIQASYQYKENFSSNMSCDIDLSPDNVDSTFSDDMMNVDSDMPETEKIPPTYILPASSSDYDVLDERNESFHQLCRNNSVSSNIADQFIKWINRDRLVNPGNNTNFLQCKGVNDN